MQRKYLIKCSPCINAKSNSPKHFPHYCLFLPPSLPQHLRSSKHLKYANSDANFASLDALIATGTSFSDFIAGVRGKKRTGPKR